MAKNKTGVSKRKVSEIPKHESFTWQDEQGNITNDSDAYAYVNSYTGNPIHPSRLTRDDNGLLIELNSNDMVIRPYKGFKYQVMPYHDTFRMYKVPIKTGDEEDFEEFAKDEYFETPLLVGEDNWKDPSETSGNYIMAGVTAAPVTTAIALSGYAGDRLFHDAVLKYNGDDIDENGMWVYNPGGWIAGGATSKGINLTKQGALNFWKWGTELYPIGEGAEAQVFGRRFNPRKIYKTYYEHDPEYMRLRSRMPESLPYKFEGYIDDGRAIYSLDKVKIPKEYNSRKFNEMLNNIMKQGFKIKNIDGNIVAISNFRNTWLDDILGNIGELHGKYKIFDPAPLSIEDGIALNYKKGGGIHIKKENRGKFTEYCGGKITNECILKGKNSSDPKIRKRATFAANARKWKKK